MVFLSALLSKVLIGLLSALGGWLVRHFQEMRKDAAAKKAAEDNTQKAVDDLTKAKTPGEIDNAAKGIADDL